MFLASEHDGTDRQRKKISLLIINSIPSPGVVLIIHEVRNLDVAAGGFGGFADSVGGTSQPVCTPKHSRALVPGKNV